RRPRTHSCPTSGRRKNPAFRSRIFWTRIVPFAPLPTKSGAMLERLREARETAIEEAARACANICRRAGEALQDGPIGPNGWPETPEGAARHQSFALADAIEESLQHERLRALAGGERGDD